MLSLYDRCKDAIKDLREEVEKGKDEYISDSVYEIADRHCPIYYGEILEMASRSITLALEMPKCGPAYGTLNPVNLIHANIYEHIVETFFEVLNNDEEE